jgi:hypothetical protein
MTFPIKTLKSIVIDLIPNIGIKNFIFGMHKSEVRKKMKEIHGVDNYVAKGEETECYFENSLQFSFAEDETLTFIETSAPPVFVTILGIRTWKIPGDLLLNLLCEKDTMNMEISEGGSNPIFQKTHIALWGLDEHYDHFGNLKVLKWGAIGIGDDRYYNKICSIYNR